MIIIDKLEKDQKLYFIGATGIEVCEVLIEQTYMMSDIRYGEKRFKDHIQKEEFDILYVPTSAVVKLSDNHLRVLMSRDGGCYFYTEEACKEHILTLHTKLTKEHSNDRNTQQGKN